MSALLFFFLGKTYKMKERQIIGYCKQQPNGLWDGIDVRVCESYYEDIIDSLRQFVQEMRSSEIVLPSVDLFQISDKDPSQDDSDTKFALRWQAILDKTQGTIFRKPLDSQIVLLGPPGTGKTTTLIKRLYQKLFCEENDEEEIFKYRYKAVPPQKDWLVFTPTELLRLSLKNSISNEGVAADDYLVRTWEEYRQITARNDLELLKTSKHDGFLLSGVKSNLSDAVFSHNLEWLQDFDEFQKKSYLNRVLKNLKASWWPKEANDSKLIDQIVRKIQSEAPISLYELFKAAEDALSLSKEEQIAHKKALKEKVNAVFNLLNNLSQGKFLKDWKEIIHDNSSESTTIEIEQDDVDVLEQDAARVSESQAITKFSRLVLMISTSRANGTPLARSGEDLLGALRKLKYWKESVLEEASRGDIAGRIAVLRRHRFLSSLLQRYRTGYFRRYVEFRKTRQKEGTWYSEEVMPDREISSHECDLVLASYFGTCDELLQRARNRIDAENTGFWSPVKRFAKLQKMQILIDEVTDFSPVQLRCMYLLAREKPRSIFACGDLNQRMTQCGVRDKETLKVALRNAQVQEIRTSYRQSVSLHKFAQAIIHNTDEYSISKIGEKNIGMKPILSEKTGSSVASAERICQWIRQIDSIVNAPISIAVFVPSENLVEVVTDVLKSNLRDISLDVYACRDGQSVGQAGGVRVFDVVHIKGLEFDAAFFLDLDCMKDFQNLFVKVLYVGATRARSFLGVTCTGKLPDELNYLKEEFINLWDET